MVEGPHTAPASAEWSISAKDYVSTNDLVEFEAEFENGISEIERDDDDDDDGDDD